MCQCVSSYVDVWALFGAWRCRGLEMQQGATADTETLQPAGSNPFWTSPGTNMGPYVWESTSALLRYAKGERDENILPAALPPAIRSVIKSSCEHKWGISKGREKTNKTKRKTNTCTQHSTISSTLPGRRGKSKLHKADICHSDSTQIVDYCFD